MMDTCGFTVRTRWSKLPSSKADDSKWFWRNRIDIKLVITLMTLRTPKGAQSIDIACSLNLINSTTIRRSEVPTISINVIACFYAHVLS